MADLTAAMLCLVDQILGRKLQSYDWKHTIEPYRVKEKSIQIAADNSRVVIRFTGFKVTHPIFGATLYGIKVLLNHMTLFLHPAGKKISRCRRRLRAERAGQGGDAAIELRERLVPAFCRRSAVIADKTGRDCLLGLGAGREKTAFDLARCRTGGHSSDHALSRIAAAAKRRKSLGDDAFRVEAHAGIEFLRLVMIEKTVG